MDFESIVNNALHEAKIKLESPDAAMYNEVYVESEEDTIYLRVYVNGSISSQITLSRNQWEKLINLNI